MLSFTNKVVPNTNFLSKLKYDDLDTNYGVSTSTNTDVRKGQDKSVEK